MFENTASVHRLRLGSRIPILLVLLGIPLLTGCAGARIRATYDARMAEPETLERTARAPEQANQPPYQLAFRLGPGFLDKMTTAMFGDAIANPEGLKKKMSEGNSGGEGRSGGPFGGAPFGGGGGPLGGLLGRIVGGGGGGGGGLNLNPQLTAKGVGVNFPAECPGCLRLRFDVEGGLGEGELRNLKMGGQITVAARLQSVEHKGQPALQVSLDTVDALDLQLPIALPGPLAMLETRVEEGLRDTLSTALANQKSQTQRTIALADKFKRDGMALEGLGIHTRPSPGGELFVGLNTTLNAAPSVRFDPKTPGLENADWALLVGDETVTAMLRQAVKAGKVPQRYNTKGKPDPEGKVALDLQAIHFTPEGFELKTRVYYLGWPAFWRDYTVFGNLTMEDGQLKPKVVDMVAGKGDGAAWLTFFVERRMNTEKAVGRMGKTFPSEMPLPIGEGKSARLTPVFVTPTLGALAVGGMVSVVEQMPKTPKP